jgi:hypothetical protein
VPVWWRISANTLDFMDQTQAIHHMIAVETNETTIRVRISTDGMPAEAVSAFVDWLRVEMAARRSHLTGDTAWKLSEEVKSGWWTQNQDRLPQ